MRALTQTDLMALWEEGRALHPLDQAVLAAEAAFPGERAADWPLGRRNRALAALHCTLFGPALSGWTHCRTCDDQLEFRIEARALAEAEAATPEDRVAVGPRRYRLPTSRDLAAVIGEADAAEATRRLLQRCLADGRPGQLGALELEAVGDQMAKADPLAEIRLTFQCPSCGGAYDETLDLASFLWAEMEGHVRGLLAEVDALARAYGWSEPQILAISPARRRVYLEMVGV
jgi:hypothetical protein